MHCRYCYVERGKFSRSNLNLEDCKKAVDFLLNQPGEEKLIKFMGGEPLLRFDLLKKISKYAKEKSSALNKRLCLTLATNGTLLDKNKISFLEKFNFLIFLSIDGDKKNHDLNRKFLYSKKSSYEEIFLNIAGMDTDRIIVNYVITPASTEKLIKNVESLWKMGIRKINFRIDISVLWEDDDLNNLQSAFLEFLEFYIDCFRKEKEDIFSISQIHEILQRDLNYTSRWCKEINLAPDGRFYSCCRILSLDAPLRYQYALGSLSSGVNNQERTMLLERCREEIKNLTVNICHSCPLSKYCFCLISSYICCAAEGRDFSKTFQMECRISKIFITAFLKIISFLKKQHNPIFEALYLKK